MAKQKIVTLGWGTGSLMLLTGLRKYADDSDVATIMAMADDGGSTGRMRKEFDMPAFGGDFRDALVGLAENEALAKIFMHRFEKWTDLRGHSVWNIILLWLFEATGGNIPQALDIAHKILRVRGKVYPSTTEKVDLVCEYNDGSVLESQNEIDNTRNQAGKKVTNTYLKPSPKAYEKAIEILSEADKIVLWPGDLYSNVVANIIVDGIAEAIKNSKAEKIYICNLMTKYNQTHDFTSSNFVDEVYKYLGCYPDHVIVNNDLSPTGIDIKQYESEHRHMVKDDSNGTEPYHIIREKVWLEGKEFKRVKSDVVPRSFIRHDPDKLAEIIVNI